MKPFELQFEKINYSFPMVFVEGTGENHFRFGLENDQLRIKTKDFFISGYPVTQLLWEHIMGNNPAQHKGADYPVEMVSHSEITTGHGFLKKLQLAVQGQLPSTSFQFRLPTETEWEYAARGGIYWGDYFIYSGSDNIDEVGWYKHNSNNETKRVGAKKPNQLGIYEMCGNVWEWCADYYQWDTRKIPLDGSPCMEQSDARVLRGGCFHNGGIHCTVMKRYEIGHDSQDPCIGLRVVLAVD